MSRFYVYALYDWLGIPRYIGAGTANRWLTSEMDVKSNPEKDKFVRETREKLGHIPKLKLYTGLTRDESFTKEIELIDKIGRMPNGPLTNIYPGGKGYYVGQIYTDERNAKVSAALTGRPKSQAHREALAAALAGRPLPPAQLANVVAAAKRRVGAKMSAESSEKKRAANAGKKRTPEQLARIRAAVARRPSRKGISLTPAQRANQSAGAKARWERDPTPRAAKGPDGRFTEK